MRKAVMHVSADAHGDRKAELIEQIWQSIKEA